MEFAFLPAFVKAPLRPFKRLYDRARYTVGFSRHCPICDSFCRKFMPFGRAEVREDAMCPYCGSLERMRFAWLYFQQCGDLFNTRPKKVLHVAPEKCMEPLFRKKLGSGYVTADISGEADVRMDLTEVNQPDNTFDVIYCSHVLEHIPDDRKAMREIHRILKPSGWAALMVPIKGDKTDEDLSVTDPQERLKRFGLEDHVRMYGMDFAQRLRECRFNVSVMKPDYLFNKYAMKRHGLTNEAGEIFVCRKSPNMDAF